MPVAEPDQFREHGLVDVVELVDVQAASAELVPAQPAEDFGGLRPIDQAVEGQAGFPGGEADRRGIALPAARVLVVVAAEAHNRRTPHLRRFARYFRHQRQQAEPVGAPDRMLDGGQELLHRRAGCLRFVFSHEGSLAERGTPVRGGGGGGSREKTYFSPEYSMKNKKNLVRF